MRAAGFEPARPCGHRGLDPARLHSTTLARGTVRLVKIIEAGAPAPDHDHVTVADGSLMTVHSWKTCAGQPCPFHNPSGHHMADWPFTIRMDKWALVERVCVHGVGHPDPDSVLSIETRAAEQGLGDAGWVSVHGCCGAACCSP